MSVIAFETPKINREQKQQLAKEFTESAAKIAGIPKSGFYVFIKRNELDNVGVGGHLLSNSK